MPLIPYLKYYFKAQTKYQIHSPFVFDFIENVLEDNRNYYYFKTIERFRQIWNKSDVTIDNTPVWKLAEQQAVSPATGQLLFKIINHYKPLEALELGAFPGISTLYQSTPSRKLSLYTIENSPSLTAILQAHLTELGVQNVQLTRLSEYTLTAKPPLEYIFIKNMIAQAEIASLIQKNRLQLVVFHQPHLDKKRAAYWQWLQAQPSVTLSLDIYQLGVLFFRTEQKETAHYQLIKAVKKPWAMF